MRPTVALAAGLLAVVAAGCGGPADDPVPPGVDVVVEQTRTDLAGRNLQAQVVNGGDEPLTVEAVELRSSRFDGAATYDGPAVVQPGATTNLTMEMPRARCGEGTDLALVVEHAVAGERRTSRLRPTDRYGSVGRFMARDCAESRVVLTLGEAFTVRGRGRASTLEVPLEVAALGPVRVGGVGSTVLLDVVGGGSGVAGDLGPDDPPARTVLRLRPARCDVHVVAEDRAGTLLPVRVAVAGQDAVPVLLRMDERQKAEVFEFVAGHCGFGEVDDPLQDG